MSDHEKIQKSRKLQKASSILRKNLDDSEPWNRVPICLMEGATDLSETSKGRRSTDPDENMALRVIAAVAAYFNKSMVVVVPDADNQQHTHKFLAELGVRVRYLDDLKDNHPLEAGVIYLARLNDRNQMKKVFVQTEGTGADVFGLGPVFSTPENTNQEVDPEKVGYAEELLGENTRVTGMGLVKKDEANKRKLSTNSKGPECATFVDWCLKNPDKATWVPSLNMGPSLAIPVAELLDAGLITEKNVEQWCSNSKEQFMCIGGLHGLMDKRLIKGMRKLLKVDESLVDADVKPSISILNPNGKGLLFNAVFKDFNSVKLKSEAVLEAACKELGEGYEFLLASGGGELPENICGK